MGHRSLAFILGAIFVLASGGASALGLGNVELDSYLNQPLKAEIELYEVRELTEEEIKVKIAAKEDFDRIGVDRTYFLSDLRFEVILDDPKGAYIRVSSKKIVREPFLNFVLQVQWPSGRLLREYTVLLDLPVYSDAAAPSVSAAQSQPATASTQTQRPSSPQPTSDYNPRSVYEAAPPRPSASSAAPISPTYTDDTYRVRANDTLWEIAMSIRPNRSVSIHQTMLALQRANPEAFINNNINLLKEGQILRMPGEEEMRELSQGEAVQEVAVQNAAWRGESYDAQVSDAQLSAVDSYDDTSTSSSAPEGRLKLASPDEIYSAVEGRTSGGSADVSSEALENELAISLEQLDKSNRENNDLRSKVESLEQQIETMERMLEVSNESLRAMELSLAQQAQDEAQAEADAALDSAVDDMADDAGELDLAAELESATSEDTSTVEDDSTAMEAESDESAADAEAIAKETAAPNPTPKPTPVPPPASTLVDTLMANILYIGIGIAVVVIGVVALIVIKQKKADEEDFDDFLEDHGLGEDDSDDTVLMPPRDRGQDDEEDDFDLGDIDQGLDEVEEEAPIEEEDEEPIQSEAQTEDVVAEADIYIAYGKYDQAEEMLLKALANDESDENIRLKLLEVYSTQGNIDSFDPQYAQLRATASPASIERADALRANIPGAPAFDESSVAGSSSGLESDDFAGGGDSDDGDFGLDLDLPEDDNDGGLDLDLGDLDSDGDPDASLDLDLGDEVEDDIEEDSLALDFDLGDDDSSSDSDDVGDLGDLDLDLGDDDEDSSDDGLGDLSALDADLGDSDDDGLDLDLGDDLDGDLDGGLDISADLDASFDLDDGSDSSSDDGSDVAHLDLGMDALDIEADDASSESGDGDDIDLGGDLDLGDDLDLGGDLDLGDDLESGLGELDIDGDDSSDDDLASLEMDLDDVSSSEPEGDLGDLDIDSELGDLDLGDSSEPSITGDTVVNEALNEEFLEQTLGGDVPLNLEENDDLSTGTSGETEVLDAIDVDDDTDLDLSSLDQELDALTSDLDDDITAVHQKPDLEEPITDFDDFEADLEADEPSAPAPAAESTASKTLEFELPEVNPEDVDDDDLDFLSDSDETATKLDLARAYIDMGDQEGAREIIREVMNEGNDQQKSEAQNLLSRMEA